MHLMNDAYENKNLHRYLLPQISLNLCYSLGHHQEIDSENIILRRLNSSQSGNKLVFK